MLESVFSLAFFICDFENWVLTMRNFHAIILLINKIKDWWKYEKRERN